MNAEERFGPAEDVRRSEQLQLGKGMMSSFKLHKQAGARMISSAFPWGPRTRRILVRRAAIPLGGGETLNWIQKDAANWGKVSN